MDNREVAIKISNVKKQYKLGRIGGGTLQKDLQSWWARKRGKEDPNTKIGQKERIKGSTFMALNGIDLTVYKGEALGIIGRNGAGKSTLLKLLSRVTAPTEGEIDLYGRITSMLEVGTGFNGEMTGRENIYLNGAILGMTKAEIDSKMEDIIDFSEVREFIDTPVKRYSSGMYVKLAFSVAAHLDSEIMIMDEVLAVGDMVFQKKCLDKMRDVANKEGRTVLYVSHNMNTIRQLCDRCIVLSDGQIIYNGAVEKAIAIYMGSEFMQGEGDFDIEEKTRDKLYRESLYKITHLHFHNKNELMFGDKVIFDISMINNSGFDKALFLRVLLKTPDGKAVSMSATSEKINIIKQTITTKKYEINTSRVVPGQYTLSFVLYEIGRYGVDVNIDVVRDVYVFSILPTIGFNKNMVWNPQWWGNISIGDLGNA